MAFPSETRPKGLHASPMVVGSLVGALASTAALVAVGFITAQPPPPPPPQSGQGNGGGGGGGGPLHPGIALTVVGALFALAWVAVLIAVARDQILRRIDASEDRIVARIAESMNEYGELRETDGVVYGMRQAERELTPTPVNERPPIGLRPADIGPGYLAGPHPANTSGNRSGHGDGRPGYPDNQPAYPEARLAGSDGTTAGPGPGPGRGGAGVRALHPVPPID